MNNRNEKNKFSTRLTEWFSLCPVAHCVLCVSLVLIVMHLAMRGDTALMNCISRKIIRPTHAFLAQLMGYTTVSIAELLIVLAVALVLLRVALSLMRLIRGRGSMRGAYRLAIFLVSAICAVYAGYSLLWGTYYYGDDFLAQSGLRKDPVSTEQLEAVTRYFADEANVLADSVPRDEAGLYQCDRAGILARSDTLFDATVREYQCLSGPRVSAKGIKLSRALSYLDFTGFLFPFTGEANVNTDFPSALFASTVAHELSHQRGVAKEQEANFVAVLASMCTEDSDFRYSAALLAYTHLGNALYSVDYAAWERVYTSLDESVRLDLSANNAYWRQFDTPVQTVSNTVYDGFLKSYDQTLGMKSYGACVDLLVNYYYPMICQK